MTTQLVDTHTGVWDEELIGTLGCPKYLLGVLSIPETTVDSLRGEIRR